MRAFLQGNAGICYMMSTINAFMLHPKGRVIMFNALKDYMEQHVTTHSAKVSFTTPTNTCPVGHRKFEFFKALYFAFKDAQNSSGRSSRSAYNLMKNLSRSVRTRPNMGGLTPTVLPEIMNRLNIKCNIYDTITNRPTRRKIPNPDVIIYLTRSNSAYLPDEVEEYDGDEDDYRLGSASFGFDLPGNGGGHEMAGVHCGDNSWYVVDSARSANPIQRCDWWQKSTLIRHVRGQSGYPAATNIGFSYFVYYKNNIPTTYNTSTINRMLRGVASMNVNAPAFGHPSQSGFGVVGTAHAIAPSFAVQMRGRARKNATPARKNATPARKNATPNRKNATPNRKNATPNRKNATPNRKNATPARKNATPNRKNATPNRKNATPNRKNATPNRKNATPNRKNATPARKNNNSK